MGVTRVASSLTRSFYGGPGLDTPEGVEAPGAEIVTACDQCGFVMRGSGTLLVQ